MNTNDIHAKIVEFKEKCTFIKKCFKTDEESVRQMSISNCKPLFKTTVIRCILLIKQ